MTCSTTLPLAMTKDVNIQQLCAQLAEDLKSAPSLSGLTAEQLDELYAYDPDEPWWCR